MDGCCRHVLNPNGHPLNLTVGDGSDSDSQRPRTCTPTVPDCSAERSDVHFTDRVAGHSDFGAHARSAKRFRASASANLTSQQIAEMDTQPFEFDGTSG